VGPTRRGIMRLCKRCRGNITFNAKIQKWVTKEEKWRCDGDRPHEPTGGKSKRQRRDKRKDQGDEEHGYYL
jgi:hypothetical protein